MLRDLLLASLQSLLGQSPALLGHLLLRLLGEGRILADSGMGILVDGFNLSKRGENAMSVSVIINVNEKASD